MNSRGDQPRRKGEKMKYWVFIRSGWQTKTYRGYKKSKEAIRAARKLTARGNVVELLKHISSIKYEKIAF